jgi:TonB family protein
LRAVDDVVLTARMVNGAPAPSTIVLPQLRNRADVVSFIRQNYPDSLTAPPTVVPVVWVYIDEAGKPHLPELIVTSGTPMFDKLAIDAVHRAQFSPALVDTFRVGLWVMLPVQVGGLAQRPPVGPCRNDGPCFTPYTTKPQLLNREIVQRALVQNYPPELRDRRIGGTTLVWVLVDEGGRVAKAQVKETSGHKQLDEAALRVARSMLYTPALNDGAPVKVWIQLPIVFKTF